MTMSSTDESASPRPRTARAPRFGLRVAAMLATAGVAGGAMRGGLDNILVSILAGACTLIILGYILITNTFNRRRQQRDVLSWISAMCFGLSLSILPGTFLLRRDVAESREYCDRIIACIWQIKSQSGVFPDSISGCRSGITPPLLKNGPWYFIRGDGFIIEFGEGMGVFDVVHMYNSHRRMWETRMD